MADPAPFEIVERDGVRVATNGARAITLLDADGKLFLRRAIRGIGFSGSPLDLLPKVNALAGDIHAGRLTGEQVAQRLAELQQQAAPPPVERVEWAVARLGDVCVYLDGENVVVTRQNLNP